MAKRVLILTEPSAATTMALGRVLMKSFLYSLARNPERPSAVMFMNEGVRLACEGSGSLDDLALLAENGVAVRACGTCLDYLGLTAKLAVGEVGNMNDSVAALMGADDVVTIA